MTDYDRFPVAPYNILDSDGDLEIPIIPFDRTFFCEMAVGLASYTQLAAGIVPASLAAPTDAATAALAVGRARGCVTLAPLGAGLSYRLRGAYGAGTAYSIGDVYTNAGVAYYVTQAGTGPAAVVTALDDDWPRLVAVAIVCALYGWELVLAAGLWICATSPHDIVATGLPSNLKIRGANRDKTVIQSVLTATMSAADTATPFYAMNGTAVSNTTVNTLTISATTSQQVSAEVL